MTTTRTRPLALLAATCLVALAGCGLGADPVARSDSRALDSATSASEDPTTTQEPERVVQPEDPACAPGEGKQVEEIDDVTIAAFTVEDFVVPDETLGDVVVPGFRVPGFSVPETVVEGGCVARHDAPGACLGAVEVTDVAVPEARVPDAEIAPVVVDGETLFDGDVSEGGTADAGDADGGRREQTCQVEPGDGGVVGMVVRGGIVRGGVVREGVVRAGLTRPRICVDVEGREECTDVVSVPPVALPPASVPPVAVDPAVLDAYVVEGSPDTTAYTDDSSTAYVTPAEVLFDFDESDIKPEAATSLAAIAAKIPAGATVTVEGHTDDQGTDAYNQTLSEARAASVAAWLTADAGVASGSITTEGLGESAPAASNSSDAGRAQNRRVVITVTTS